MKAKATIATLAELLLFALVLLICLFSDTQVVRSVHIFSVLIDVLSGTIKDARDQWLLMLDLSVILVLCCVLELRQRNGKSPSTVKAQLCMLGCLLIGMLQYLFNYATASQTTGALTLVAGMTFAKWVGVWDVSRRQSNYNNYTSVSIVTAIAAALFSASLWHTESSAGFTYRGQLRWTGPWRDPNTYGLFMAVGATLSICGLTLRFKPFTLARRSIVKEYATLAVYISSIVAVVIGLYFSYSRGAWFSAICGLSYNIGCLMQVSNVAFCRMANGTKPSVVALAALSVCITVICFWHLRFTELTLGRRLVSLVKANDFSWHNRVDVWQGMLQIKADRPWFGYGWNLQQQAYNQFYRSSGVAEIGAIDTNSYLVLGVAIGLPALSCFLVYVWTCFDSGANNPGRTFNSIHVTSQYENSGNRRADRSERDYSKSVCRAGAIVFLVGFWFDGGLFKMATAAPFWILIDLGRED